MNLTINLHPGSVKAVRYQTATWLAVTAGDGELRIFPTVAMCDELIKAAIAAKSLLLDETSDPVPGHPFVRPGQVDPDRPAPDRCMVCGEPEAAHPAPEPDPEAKHGRYDAASAAEVAADVDGRCGNVHPDLWVCALRTGHSGDHVAFQLMGDPAGIACRQRQAPEPFPHFPHLPQHVGGRPACVLCGIDHDADIRLAPPVPYQLPAIELANDVFTDGAV